MPNNFIKLLRKTHDGMQSQSLVESNPLVLNVAYTELSFELSLAKKGGMKRGFLQTEKTVTQAVVDALKDGQKALVVELLSRSSAAAKLRRDCQREGIPYLRYYYDYEGWWNTRSYVTRRTAQALEG